MSSPATTRWIFSRAGTVTLLLLLALSFQGSRGLWEPDEGRHASIAAAMLGSGDWLVPELAGQRFIDKPPLLFWGMAGGLALLGENEWGARLCLSLFYLLTALAIARLGQDLRDRETGTTAALVWGAAFLPFAAGNAATPDLPLACCSAWTWVWVVRAARFGDAGAAGDAGDGPAAAWGGRRAWLFAGFCAGLGLLAKGPALLVELPPLLVFVLVDRKLRPWAAVRGIAIAGVAALAVAAIWYLPMLLTVPGAGAYLFDNQIAGRLFSGRYERHPGLVGALWTYAPTLLAGALPWWPATVAGIVRRIRALGAKAAAARLLHDPAAALLAAGVLVPLGVFALASSKLPLYILPAWTPLALAAAWLLGPRLRASARLGPWLLVWCGFLLAFKAGAAYLPTGARDSRNLARAIEQRMGDTVTGVIAVDSQANGLYFYGVADFHWLRSGEVPYPLFEPPVKIETALPGIAAEGRPHLVIASPKILDAVRERFERLHWSCGEAARYERLAGRVCTPPAPAPYGTVPIQAR